MGSGETLDQAFEADDGEIPELPSTICDVVVIGGGPAGTTTATLLARRGWSVTLLERDHHPRFHIGESLLPMNLPLFDALGVLERVQAIGVRKRAADFTGPSEDGFHVFPFANALGGSPDHAFQVTRAQLDALLFQHCRDSGAQTMEGWHVDRVDVDTDGTHTVSGRAHDGRRLRWRCRYLVDASGQETVLARQQGWRERDRRHSAAAFFAHFRGIAPREAPWAGNISVYWFDWGWIWMIPLQNGVTSVGAVCRSDFVRNRRAELDDFFHGILEGCPAAAARLADAERISPVRSAANYSYFSRRQTGPGFALVGDAYTFVDPVFSSGVYIAMSSAFALAPAIDLWLEGHRWRYRVAAYRYRRRVRRGIRAFKWFIYRFNTPAMRWLFNNPRNVLKVERAVVSMLAGDVYDRPTIRARLLIFKTLFAIVAAIHRWSPAILTRPAEATDPATRNLAPTAKKTLSTTD